MDGDNFQEEWMIQCICRGSMWCMMSHNMRAKICWIWYWGRFGVQQIKKMMKTNENANFTWHNFW